MLENQGEGGVSGEVAQPDHRERERERPTMILRVTELLGKPLSPILWCNDNWPVFPLDSELLQDVAWDHNQWVLKCVFVGWMDRWMAGPSIKKLMTELWQIGRGWAGVGVAEQPLRGKLDRKGEQMDGGWQN